MGRTRARGSHDRWGRVARDVLITAVIGCVLATAGISDVVDHADPEDELAGLAFLFVVVTYVVTGILMLLVLLVGLVRRLETASLVALALLNVAVGVWLAWWARPSDPGCLSGCGSQHGTMPAGAVVLLWAAAIVHVAAAAVLARRLRRPSEARTRDRPSGTRSAAGTDPEE